MPYVAVVGADSIKGITNAAPYDYSDTPMPNPKVAIASQAAMGEGNGGWAALYGADPLPNNKSTLQLAIEEDLNSDSERNRTTEQVAFFVTDPPMAGPIASKEEPMSV